MFGGPGVVKCLKQDLYVLGHIGVLPAQLFQNPTLYYWIDGKGGGGSKTAAEHTHCLCGTGFGTYPGYYRDQQRQSQREDYNPQ